VESPTQEVTRIQVHLNNGNGTFNATQLEIDGNSGGLYLGNVVLGDFDNDGDLDILASGTSQQVLENFGSIKTTGTGRSTYTQIEVDGPGGGSHYSGVLVGAILTMMGISIFLPAEHKRRETPANFAFIKTTGMGHLSMHHKSR
jgi:hypothetical protein